MRTEEHSLRSQVGIGSESQCYMSRLRMPYATNNNAHQFQGQKVKGHIVDYCCAETKSITEREGLGIGTAKLVHRSSMRYQLPRPTIKAYCIVLARGRRNTVSAAPRGHAACLLCQLQVLVA